MWKIAELTAGCHEVFKECFKQNANYQLGDFVLATLILVRDADSGNITFLKGAAISLSPAEPSHTK